MAKRRLQIDHVPAGTDHYANFGTVPGSQLAVPAAPVAPSPIQAAYAGLGMLPGYPSQRPDGYAPSGAPPGFQGSPALAATCDNMIGPPSQFMPTLVINSAGNVYQPPQQPRNT